MSAHATTTPSAHTIRDQYVAEIDGLVLSEPLAPSDVAFIKDQFRQHPVLVFHGQAMTPPDVMVFGEYFGTLAPHAQLKYRVPGYPACSYVSNREPDGSIDEFGYDKRAVSFHSDGSFKEIPDAITVLHGLEVPQVGGATDFCDTSAAYEALTPAQKAQLDGMVAVHNSHRGIKGNRGPSVRDPKIVDRPPSEHPIVIIHPDSGRKAIYVNPVHTERVAGLSDDDSRDLLQMLYDHCAKPEFAFAHKWTKGDVVMWDQRCTMHRAGGGVPRDQARILLRTMIVTGQPLV